MSTTDGSLSPENVKSLIADMLMKQGNIDAVRSLLGSDAPYSDGMASTETEYWLSRYYGRCKEILELKQMIRLLSNVNDSVLLWGDTGTGKEILAHALHSKRKGQFVALNCAGLPEHLVESELFGHRKGAFTGAISDKVGMCIEANGGTLFLDEIGELNLAIQAKLLRAMQEKRIRQVGDNLEQQLSFRLVAATHHNLETLVTQRLFREDLYARLSTFTVKLPSIKERGETEALYLLRKCYGLNNDSDVIPPDLLSAFYIAWEDGIRLNYRDVQHIVRRFEVLVQHKTERIT